MITIGLFVFMSIVRTQRATSKEQETAQDIRAVMEIMTRDIRATVPVKDSAWELGFENYFILKQGDSDLIRYYVGVDDSGAAQVDCSDADRCSLYRGEDIGSTGIYTYQQLTDFHIQNLKVKLEDGGGLAAITILIDPADSQTKQTYQTTITSRQP